MGATFYWILVKPQFLSVNARSDWRNAMEEVFTSFPIKLSVENIPQLEAMRAANKNEKNTYDTLIDALTEHGEIEVRVDY